MQGPHENQGSAARLLSFIRNLFVKDVYIVPEDLQEEFLEQKNDLAAQDMYQRSTMEKFLGQCDWHIPKPIITCTRISFAICINLPVGEWISISSRIKSKHIKSKHRNHLAVESGIRCTLSSTVPNIEKVVSEKKNPKVWLQVKMKGFDLRGKCLLVAYSNVP